MTVSTKAQETQAKVLSGMQKRYALGMTQAATAAYLGRLFGLSQQSVSASLKLLEDKGLVKRWNRGYARDAWGHKTRLTTTWYLTTDGLNSEVK